MTIEETKRWLNRGFKLDREINQLEEAKRNMLDIITNTTPNYDGEVVSGTRSPHKYDTYVEYCDSIDRRIDELVSIKQEIQEAIAIVPDNMQRLILISRYINFKQWEQIAFESGYSYQRIFEIHKKALTQMSKLIKTTE